MWKVSGEGICFCLWKPFFALWPTFWPCRQICIYWSGFEVHFFLEHNKWTRRCLQNQRQHVWQVLLKELKMVEDICGWKDRRKENNYKKSRWVFTSFLTLCSVSNCPPCLLFFKMRFEDLLNVEQSLATLQMVLSSGTARPVAESQVLFKSCFAGPKIWMKISMLCQVRIRKIGFLQRSECAQLPTSLSELAERA